MLDTAKNDSQMNWEEAVLWLRHQPDQADLVRNCFYDDPLLESAERYYQSSEWKAVREILAQTVPGTALDIGAGRGISSYALAKDGWQVTALEPDRSSVVGSGAIRHLAKQANLNINVIETYGEDLPCPAGSMDLVLARQVLHHSRDLRGLCRKIYRVLKPSGLFIAIREHVISRKEDLPLFLESHPLHRLYGGENAYLLQEYLDAIKQSGIKLIQVWNPLGSDINLFPDTRSSFKESVAKKMKWPWPQLIPDFSLRLLGSWLKTPGRLYSFMGRKPA